MAILDHRGEPIRKRDLAEEISGPTVTGTRSIWTSALTRNVTPARLAAILRETERPGHGASERQVELAEIMEERDLHYLGVISTRKRQVAQIGIQIEPASDSAEDVRDADLVRECLERDAVEDELVDILDAVAKGYSVAEIIWDMSEREWRPVRLEHRLPQWFDYDHVTGTRLQMRADEGGWVDLAPYKFVVHAPRVKAGLPIRGGLARCAAFAWIAKTYTLRDWVQFSEIYGRPFRLGKYHKGATADEKAVLFRAVRELGADAAAIIPEEMMIEFPSDSSGATHADMHRELVRYLDSQMAIAALGQTLTTDTSDSGTGSYALGQVHNLVREDIERSDARQLAATLRRDLVIPVVTLNHGPRKVYPKVVIARTSQPDLEMLSKSLERLIPLGLRVRADQVRTLYNLEPPDGDDEVLTPPVAGSSEPRSTDPPAAPPARARDAGGEDPRATAAAEDDEDPLTALISRTRDLIGPLVDAWAERIHTDLQAAESLEEFRERLGVLDAWTGSPRAATPEVGDVIEALGPALAAAHLAGRYDVTEAPAGPDTGVALASDLALCAASAEHTQLPFAEQIEFFRSKVDLPTEAWTDIWHEQHDRAFVVAGAAHADLMADLRGAVDQAIAEGTTLRTFRQDFDAIVAKHGWSYRGKRSWRTEVIYGTNLRTSYAAGRYRQMKDIAERRPYWRYRHSHASERPRHDHLAWDGRVLRHDDPWWDTHYPPNGWGCKCYVEALGQSDLERLGKSGPDSAPDVKMRTVTVGEKGPSPRTVEVPVGIDPGWAYAPGQSVVRNTPTPADPWAIGEITRADATARQVGRQRGSNPGGLYEGADGVMRYVKWYEDPAQAYGEAIANRTYRELGIDAPVSALVRDGDAIVGIASEMLDHSGTLGAVRRLPKGRSKEVLKGFSADVWLANWDAVGLDLDNIVVTRKGRSTIARIDQGGALLMRARRGRKPVERLEQLTEWDGFSSATRNPAYTKVFRAAGYDSADELGRQALRQIEAIRALGQRTDGFRRLAPSVRGVAEADQLAIREMLARRAALLESQIVPRVRAAMRAARDPAAHQARTRAAMGQWYHTALRNAGRKIDRGAPRQGMTDPELATLYAYTSEHWTWSHYRPLNDELRDAATAGRVPARRVEDYALTLNDALDKLPDQTGTFWRGVTLTAAEQAEYVPGRIRTWGAYSSSSRTKGREFRRNTRFVITGRRGKYIRAYSDYPSEDEVLLKAGTRVRVLRKWREGGNLYVAVEEVDDA